MGLGGSITLKRTVQFTGIVIGSGPVNLNHKLNNSNVIWSVREPSTDNVFFGPLREVDANNSEIDWQMTAPKTVNVTITG